MKQYPLNMVVEVADYRLHAHIKENNDVYCVEWEKETNK